jgi:hypothetical protein
MWNRKYDLLFVFLIVVGCKDKYEDTRGLILIERELHTYTYGSDGRIQREIVEKISYDCESSKKDTVNDFHYSFNDKLEKKIDSIDFSITYKKLNSFDSVSLMYVLVESDTFLLEKTKFDEDGRRIFSEHIMYFKKKFGDTPDTLGSNCVYYYDSLTLKKLICYYRTGDKVETLISPTKQQGIFDEYTLNEGGDTILSSIHSFTSKGIIRVNKSFSNNTLHNFYFNKDHLVVREEFGQYVYLYRYDKRKNKVESLLYKTSQ